MSKSRNRQFELSALNYGYFGLPLYDSGLKRWTFSKHLQDTSRVFKPLGSSNELVAPTGPDESDVFLREHADSIDGDYYTSLNVELQQLFAKYPEVQPAEDCLKPLVRLSEGIASALQSYEPAASRLADVGTISYTSGEKQEAFRLLAIPGGKCGQDLRFFRLESRTCELGEDGMFDFFMPANEVGSWTGKGAPILQICFSQCVERADKSSLLAIRLQACVVLMFPRYHHETVHALEDRAGNVHSSLRVEPNVLFELSSSDAQGVTLADISFNPWTFREFVIIDQAGQWTIFTVVRQQGDHPVYCPQLAQKGRLPKAAKEEEEHESAEAEEEGFGTQDVAASLNKAAEQTVQAAQSERVATPEWLTDAPSIKSSASRQASPRMSEISSALSSQSGQESASAELEASAIASSARAADTSASEDDDEPEVREDGWARATWILNKDTIVVCSRKAIHLLDRRTNEYFDLPNMRMTDTRSPGWFLDIKLCYAHTDHLLVLTSHSLFLLRVYQISQPASGSTEERARLKGILVVSALHFRDPTDTSLRLNISGENSGYMVTIFSQWNRFMTCFEIHYPSPSGQSSISEAIPLIVPNEVSDRTLDLVSARMNVRETPAGKEVYSLHFLGRDFGLRHSFFGVHQAATKTRGTSPIFLSRADQDLPRQLQARAGFVDDDEHMNADDRDVEAGSFADLRPFQQHEPTITPKMGSSSSLLHYHEVAAAGSSNHDMDGNQLVPAMDIPELTRAIEESVVEGKVKEKEIGKLPMTLFEYIEQAHIFVEDLRTASFELEDAFTSTSETAFIKSYPRFAPLAADMANDDEEEFRFDDIYIHIMEQHVEPLHSSFPDCFKINRESMARSIATELMLASARLEPHLKQEEKVEDEETDDIDEILMQRHEEDERLSQPTVDAQRRNYRSPYRISIDEQAESIVKRLSRNVSFEPKSNQKWSLKGMVMLSHWDIGADAEEYSYRKTTQRLNREKEFLGLSEKERKRLQKKQERDRLRKSREKRKGQLLGLDSSQAPTIASSQVPAVAGSQSSTAPVRRHEQRTSELEASQEASQASQAPAIHSSQFYGASASQIPGLRTAPSATSWTSSQRAAPGFGSQQQAATPSRMRSIPGFGPQPGFSNASQSSQSRVPGPGPGGGGDDTATPSQGQSLSGNALPMRPPATNPGTSQVRASQAPALASSQQPPILSQSHRFSSQQSNSQTPRKKVKRTEGF